MDNLFVVGMGVGTVFVGLVCIVLLTVIMSAVCRINKKIPENTPAVVPAPAQVQPIENRKEIIAAVSAAVAEELGTDISAIRILSFRKI